MISQYLCFLFFLFFKQKTAYEMRISDWSSDVCSSDLNMAYNHPHQQGMQHAKRNHERAGAHGGANGFSAYGNVRTDGVHLAECFSSATTCPVQEIGRASCRERVCQYV